MILIFNLIGMFGFLCIYGVVGILYGSILLPMGELYLFLILGFIFLVGAGILFPFLLLVILKGQQTLQYQRNF
ncbi:MAG: hypothetical protein ACFFAN_02875 [Promethearchaeota archaeon]